MLATGALAVAFALAGCGSSGGSASSTGEASFIGRASNATVFIQWTRTGNSLSGSLQEAIVKEGDSISSKDESEVESSSRAFSGTIDGDGLTLTLNEGLGSTKALVGKMGGAGFTMTFPGVLHALTTIRFEAGSVSTYNAAVTALEAQTAATSASPPSSGEQSTAPQSGGLVGTDCRNAQRPGRPLRRHRWPRAQLCDGPPSNERLLREQRRTP